MLLDLQPQATGAHLLAAWNWARMRPLFKDGHEPVASAAIRAAAPPPRQVHAQVVEMLRAGDNFVALWLAALQHTDAAAAGLLDSAGSAR